MGSRTGSHQLRNGLIVSGRPEQLKEKQPTVASRAIPYTGGDVKKSGELGKMYGIDFSSGDHHHSYNSMGGPPILKPSSRGCSSSGSIRSGSNSGQMGHVPIPKKSSSSSSGQLDGSIRVGSGSGQLCHGSIPKKLSSSSSGQLDGSIRVGSGSGQMGHCPIPKKSSLSSSGPIQPTGLITSGPLSSTTGRRSGQLEPAGSFKKVVYGSAVTGLTDDVKIKFKVSRVAMWVLVVVVLIGLMAGGFVMAAVKKSVILVGVGGVLAPIMVILVWNYAYKERGLVGFLRRYADAELRGAVDGQYVKVTGVVTCGSIPLETSFQRIPRCVYASTELLEYKGWAGKSAHPRHRCFSWGRRHSEKHVADFYISDFQTGLRALVKAGYGAKVAPFVKPTTVVDITRSNRELSPNFLRWLADRSLSSDDRVMRLKEGYIKEGSTVSVTGVVRRQDNVLMIVPPPEPISTGCQWTRCLLPTYVEGLILTCDDTQNADVIPV
ncbi:hypothetical protein CQW23_27350 [Capsicum baccatum]|uniref:Ubiquitin-specific protease family C19-related protein n=1 Tax=Capsicum baccatum TaxID=33114 RepID=A0A2G2VDG2_CAPBA|nr:hypothetical protein CQW23_27350 [Capsicum baccatum]